MPPSTPWEPVVDIGTLATAMMTAQATSKSQVIAAKIIKDNAGSEKAVADLLQASTDNLQKIAASISGLGGNLDITV